MGLCPRSNRAGDHHGNGSSCGPIPAAAKNQIQPPSDSPPCNLRASDEQLACEANTGGQVMLKILIALFAVVIATTAHAASATPQLCAGQSCDLPRCRDLARSLGWSGSDEMRGISALHRQARCRQSCGPHPCMRGVPQTASQPASQPASQHMHH
jgi:hypothetical protein